MIRKFKTLGLALVAVLAMSAFVASAAQAQLFTANAYPTTVTATSALGNDDFNTEAGSVECKSHFEGTLSEASSDITITPTYTECKAFGFASATVNMNGCDYTFTIHQFPRTITVDLLCGAGKNVIITAGACEIQIPAQSELSFGTIAQNGNHVDIQANFSNINYTVTKDGFLCPFNGTGNKSGATYTQNAAVTVKPVSGGTSISFD